MARRKGGVGGIPPRPSFRIHHLDLFRKKFELRPKTTANWEMKIFELRKTKKLMSCISFLVSAPEHSSGLAWFPCNEDR